MNPATVNAILSALAEIEPYAIGAVAGAGAVTLACWVAGCFQPRRTVPPRRNPSTGHAIDRDPSCPSDIICFVSHASDGSRFAVTSSGRRIELGRCDV
jgi:hypothetical protein